MQGCFYGNWTGLLGPGASLLRAPMVGILFSPSPRLNGQRDAVGARMGMILELQTSSPTCNLPQMPTFCPCAPERDGPFLEGSEM